MLYYILVLDFETKLKGSVGEIFKGYEALLSPHTNNFKEVKLRHCCQFNPEDVFYLRENNLYTSRKLSIGFCPICGKPVCELVEWRFDGISHKTSAVGIKANDLMHKYKDDIVYSYKECNYSKFKSKPYGWVYGINKTVKSGNKEKIKQYASDFYGNKELIKIL